MNRLIDCCFSPVYIFHFGNKTVALIDKPLQFGPVQQKIDVDMVIILKNSKLYTAQLAAFFNCKQ